MEYRNQDTLFIQVKPNKFDKPDTLISLNKLEVFDKLDLPGDSNRDNSNQVIAYRNHLHSALYRLLHTVAGAADYDQLYFEDMNVIYTENNVPLLIENYLRS